MNTQTGLAPYRDRKRYAWLLSIVVPALIGSGAVPVLLTGDERTAWIGVVFVYVAIPLLDWVLGEDQSNPPESAVPRLEANRYYRYITYATVPVLWGSFLVSVWFLGTHQVAWHTQVALMLSAGLSGGLGINQIGRASCRERVSSPV